MPSATHARVIKVLREARELLALPGNDFLWSSWDTREDALRQMDSFITRIEAGEMPTRMELNLLFAPTGDIQEVAESSGWGREFLALAQRFDSAIENV